MRKGLPILLALMMASTAVGARAESIGHADLARLNETVGAIGRRLADPDARKSDASSLLNGRLAGIGAKRQWQAPTFDTLAGKPTLHTIPVDFMLAQLRLQTGGKFAPNAHKAIANGAAPALFIRGGAMSLDELAKLAAEQHPGAIERRGDAFIAHWPIVIWSDAGLVLSEGQQLELSTGEGAFVLNSGLFTIDRASLSSTPEKNTILPEFRPFLATAMTGAVQAREARFSNLGYGETGVTSGLSIIGAALYPAKMRSSFSDSSFVGLNSMSLENARDIAIVGNRFQDMLGPAIAMSGVTNSQILGNVMMGTKMAQAIDVQNRTSDVEIIGNVVLNNRGSGIFVANETSDVTIESNLLSGNGRGGVSVVRSACIDISHNVIVSNAQVGIKIRASDALSLSGNDLIANAGAGISVIDQQKDSLISVADNAFSANKSGLYGGSASEVALNANDFAGQSPILLDGEFASYVPELLRMSSSPEGAPQAFTIHPNATSTTGRASRPDCKTGS
ncbi:right-handed parallel beta-helix repeat-containing protein [Rhizobium glycinendophyticum]|uniref:Right-handed parallel beta-helix repeat-containing protein n=1 Tax=Rhizobium glycinendophyticum TaxID=2589807 RepID=A0A504TZT3_9HYPH|nr:right-handed parallel beta-helix repeat-containing protein [Rhizobium glycinendophyticum]TPP06747.1 right-handed parallel beta-helix repeat-containing protein [Rhizobium glycinendophyticum]